MLQTSVLSMYCSHQHIPGKASEQMHGLCTFDCVLYAAFYVVAGAKHGRRATWVGASGDQTYLRIDETLINAHTLGQSNIIANHAAIGQ